MGSQFDELCDDDNKIVQLNSKKKIQSTRKISKQNWQTQTWLCKNDIVNKIK